MNTEMLRGEFRKILTLEEKAKELYERYASRVGDGEIKEQFIAIREDEIEHIGIAKQLIELVS